MGKKIAAGTVVVVASALLMAAAAQAADARPMPINHGQSDHGQSLPARR